MDRDEFLGRVSAGLGRPCTPVDRPRATPPLDPPAGSRGTAPPSPDVAGGDGVSPNRDSDASDREVRLGLLPAAGLAPRTRTRRRTGEGRRRRDLPPSCVTFITGLSHSGDIAGSFCTGVHGPGDVRVWVITGE